MLLWCLPCCQARSKAQGSGPCPVGVRGFESHPPHQMKHLQRGLFISKISSGCPSQSSLRLHSAGYGQSISVWIFEASFSFSPCGFWSLTEPYAPFSESLIPGVYIVHLELDAHGFLHGPSLANRCLRRVESDLEFDRSSRCQVLGE